MAKLANSKRALIDQANSRVVIITAVAAFVCMFSLVATKTLIGQAAYQNRVINHKQEAVKKLRDDVQASTALRNSYETFVNAGRNVLEGDAKGSGPQDGNNAKIILDALPSSYDFPALTNSLDSLVTSDGLEINSINGTDDEVAQSANTVSGTPQAVPMPFEVSVTGDYATIQKLIGQFERSIRPIQVQKIDIAETEGKIKLDVAAQTFYQPAKTFKLGSTVVK